MLSAVGTEMTLVICLIVFLAFVQNATSKVYVIDLAEGTDSDEVIKLKDMFELFKKPEGKNLDKVELDKAELDKKELDSEEEACIMPLETTKAQKLQCLENLQKEKKSVGRESFFYPEYYQELYAQIPKRTIYSLYNYYGGLLKTKQPFTDLTRQQFSQDYLDIGELSRTEHKCLYPNCVTDKPMLKHERKLRGLGFPKHVRRHNKGNNILVEERSRDSDSSESDKRYVRKDRKHKKRNRFQVVFNGDSSIESEEERVKPYKSLSSESEEKRQDSNSDSDSESVEVTQKPKKLEKYAYLQGNKLYDSFRRRLQHFLPKRFHWDEDDIQHLGYYWFDGPRGKYS